MELQNIQFIKVEDIYPHPDNPRKDLGDLSELTESIKANGVMQNLTVVSYMGHGRQEPDPPVDWTVVIGHRRLAAAKAAGLETVPCVVAEMDEKQQISTMLLENMQRSDLTVLEQAKGMQMMMDLGDSIKEICQKTGFADTTVRHRIKITEIDDEILEKSMDKQIGINDFIKLEKIKDINLRNEAAKELGTSSFDWKYQNTLDKDKWQRKRAEIITELREFATEVDEDFDREDYRYFKNISKWSYKSWEVPENKDEKDYIFIAENDGNDIEVYVLKDEGEGSSSPVAYEPSPEEKARRELRDRANALSKTAYDLRRDYVLNRRYTIEDMPIILSEYLRQAIDGEAGIAYSYEWVNYLGLEMKSTEFEYSVIADAVEADPLKYMVLSYMADTDGEGNNYHKTYPEFRHDDENEELDEIYKFLTALGYEMSDEEKQLQDGSHEIFDGARDDEDGDTD